MKFIMKALYRMKNFLDNIEERAKQAILFYKEFFSDFEIPDDKFNFNMESISRIIDC